MIFEPNAPVEETQHSISTADGIRLHARTRGSGPTMLLCNGLFCTDQYYVRWWDHYGRNFHLVSFDYRGHGKSEDPPSPSFMSIDRLTDDAQTVQEALCPEPAIVVGHSMGVRIALELYRRHPERVRALILLCGSVYRSLGRLEMVPLLGRSVQRALKASEKLGTLPAVLKKLTVHLDLVSKSAYLVGGMSWELTPRQPIERLLDNLDRMDTRAMAALARSYLSHSAKEILPRVRVPVLLMVGERDALAPPSHGKEVAKQLSDVTFEVIRGATHLAPIEKPGVVHDIADAFLERLESNERGGE